MTTIHARRVGDQALLLRSELERLVELARRSEKVELRMAAEDEAPAQELLRLAEASGAFDFWREEGEDIYSETDGQPVWTGFCAGCWLSSGLGVSTPG